MNEAIMTAIAARANEAKLLKKKILLDLKERMEGLIQQIEDDRSELSDLIMLSRATTEAIRIIAIANDKLQTEELVKAFKNR